MATRQKALVSQNLLQIYQEEVSLMEGKLGASMSRLQSAASNIAYIIEGINRAEGRILDADIAEESAALVKNGILQQVGAAILAQANQQPALAIDLLKSM